MKGKKALLFLVVALPLLGLMLFIYKTVKLQHEISIVEQEKEVISNQLEEFEKLVKIDSLLLQGEYETAISSYNNSLNSTAEDKMSIPLRIALAEKLLRQNTNNTNKPDSAAIHSDSLKMAQLNGEGSSRTVDSLNFTLEKTRVQLDRVKKQLQQKSYGEYLTFKSKKGNQMHYIGQVKNGKANGNGIALLDSGSRYEGSWKDNQRHGQGTFYWPDGEYYSGNYENDLRNGFGTYHWPNGEKYAGQWKEDKRSGSGKFFDAEGDVVASGEWSEDKLIEINDR